MKKGSPAADSGEKFSRFGFYLFLFALALSPLLGGTPVGNEYANAAFGGDGMLGALRALILTAALLTYFTPSPAIAGSPVGIIARLCVAGTAAWVAISVLVHAHGFTSPVYAFAMFPEALNWLTFALTFALASRFVQEDRRHLPAIATALLVGGVICAVIGVVAFGAVPGADRATHRESATFYSPNFAAGFVALTLPLAAALFLMAETLLPLAASGAAAGLLFGLLMITGSRTGLALTMAGLVIALILTLIRRVPLNWGRVAGLVALLALFGFVFKAPMVGRVAGPPAPRNGGASPTTGGGGSDLDHSGEFRKETWKGSIAMMKANPVLGAGPGTFPYTYPRYAIVAWTGQAHSSYLQLASESGIPALALLAIGVAASLLVGLQSALKKVDAGVVAVLMPALIGGIVAALGRSVFDSEWTLLGCGVPFFAVVGMLVGSATTEPETATATAKPAARLGTVTFLVACLVMTLWIRAGESERDAISQSSRIDPATTEVKAREASGRVRPADPQLYAMAQDYATAAYLSPSGKRLYQLARYFERKGDEPKAVEKFEASVAVDPNNLQTRKALAEAQTKTGDPAGALATYQAMVTIAEGPAGKIRAIPELPDTLPAFAYTAVAEDAAKRGDAGNAEKNFATAEGIIEDYSRTPTLYQLSEIVTLGGNTPMRRAEVRSLYTDRILPGRRAALKQLGRSTEADALSQTESETTARLDAFVNPNTALGTASP